MFDDWMPARRELRPHQIEAINGLRQSFGKGLKRVILQAPTGFGKTLTTAKIIESALAKGKRVMFTVPRVALIDQAVSEFEREGVSAHRSDPGIASENRRGSACAGGDVSIPWQAP
jgi:superfamily II DNA or RNA helicase